MKLSCALTTAVVLSVAPANGEVSKTQTRFLSNEEIAEFLSAMPGTSDQNKPRHSTMTTISDELHLRLRGHLCNDGGDCVDDGIEITDAALTTIHGTTSPHKDRYVGGSDSEIVSKTGLVFLESNEGVVFVHGDDHVAAEAGKLVVFDGSEEHYTKVSEGQRGRMLGPFALQGRKLSLVGGGGSPCMTITSDTTFNDDFSCNCTFATAAIEIRNSATLNLNGYTVSCTDGSPGDAVVRMTGDGASLLNGVVDGDDADGNDCIDMEGAHQTVSGVTVLRCENNCIQVESGADYATITKNWIKECEWDAINVASADNAHISGNRIEETDEDCIHLDGSSGVGHYVFDNYLADCGDGNCIEVDSSDSKIIGNEMTGCYESGIDVTDDGSGGNEVRKNIIGNAEHGISIDEDNNLVSENKIFNVRQDGIELESGADYNTVTNNVIQGTSESGGADGIKLESGADWNVVSYNHISFIGDEGIDVEGDFNKIIENHVEKTNNALIEVDGEYNIIKGNQLRNTVGEDANGIEIGGNHNIVKDNFVSGVTEDCIDVTADNTTVIGNEMRWCGDDGVEISSDDNVIKKNRAYACDIALNDETGDDCGTNSWKNNKGNSFEPECTTNGDFRKYKKPWW